MWQGVCGLVFRTLSTHDLRFEIQDEGVVPGYFSYRHSLIRLQLSVVHSCVCVSRVLKIYRSFELRFGVKPESASESGSKPGSKLESSRGSEGRKVGTSDRVYQLVVTIVKSGNKGNKGKKVKQKNKKEQMKHMKQVKMKRTKRTGRTKSAKRNEENEENRKNKRFKGSLT